MSRQLVSHRHVLVNGKKVNIPYGFDKLVENVAAVYPDQKKSMEKFVKIIRKSVKNIIFGEKFVHFGVVKNKNRLLRFHFNFLFL